MNIGTIVSKRMITEVLHFTTGAGLTGILATKAVKPRNRLASDKYLEHICKMNCPDRSGDTEWHDHVNLSITSINAHLFGISANNWHNNFDGWWCILSFHPGILTHDGVYFTTTNNIYTGVQRAPGPKGLEAMFAQKIVRWVGKTVRRSSDIATAQPTCLQAEVLYPGELSVERLQRIYVRDAEHLDVIGGVLGALSLPQIDCVVRPSLFGR
jgi:hypothetical protein